MKRIESHDVPASHGAGSEAAAGGPSANRGMPKRWPGAVRDTSTPGLFRRVNMGDSDDVSGRGCLLALAVWCLLWALVLAWVLR